MPTNSANGELIAEKLKDKEFNDELYKAALDVALNRLESQESEISEQEICSFLRDLFQVRESFHRETIKERYKHALSESCLLKVLIVKAENLASKDVDGSSDPYCLASVVPTSQYANFKNGKFSARKTKVINSSLNPEWNESIELLVSREKVSKSYFQIQVWDYDGDNGSTKKVRGMKGMKRFVQEKAQSAVTTKSEDDFMGFNSVPLVNIPADGLESWFKLRSFQTLQDVSGRIKVRLTLNSIIQRSKNHSKYSTDLLYAGLLRKLVHKVFDEYMDKMKENADAWNGFLPIHGKILIHEFEEQHRIVPFTAAIVRWEVYSALHVQRSPGLDLIFMEKMLGDLEANSQYAQNYHKSTQFTVDMLCHSFKQFIHEEGKKISRHRESFPVKKPNFIINLRNVLLIFKKISTMGLYQILRTLDPTLVSDVRMSVIEALQRGTTEYYVTLYDQLLDESLEADTNDDKIEEINKAFGGTDVGVLIKLTESLHKDLLVGKTYYHAVFIKRLDIDYLSYVSVILEKHLANDANATMKKANKLMANIELTPDTEANNSLLFKFFIAMRDLAAVTRKKGTGNNQILSSDSPKRTVDSLVGTVETDGPTSNLDNYHDWFRPILLKWLQMSRGKTHSVLNKAVELDAVRRVDDIVKHSSSAVDTVACLTGHVVTFWRNLQWPDPVDAYTIALRLTDDMANAIETYADLVYKKLRDVGFFDDEGQFDVTEELCLALNNLQYVKAYLIDLPKKMDFQGLADAVEAHPEGPSGNRAMTTFTSLISSADIGMKKKIKNVTAGVGVKMKPDIRRYLRQFAQKLIQQSNHENEFLKKHDVAVRSKLEEIANEAIKPLMNYLRNNLVTLHEWLCEPNFHRILEVLWEVTVQSLQKVALVEYVEQKPGFFYQFRYVFDAHLLDFFHAEGSGISLNKLRNGHDSKLLDSELKMRSARTRDLIKLFYMQMYEEQQKLAVQQPYGFLNVYAWYEGKKEVLHVDVISANKLVPLDMNGLSDPFVQLRLAPAMLFRNQRSHQTLVQKNTLDPLWEEENFSFQVERALVAQEGTVVIFTVLDHDIISSNDLEGEAVLPLNMLDGAVAGGKKISRTFRLPLTQPQKLTKSPSLDRQTCDENANGIVGDGQQCVKSSFSDVTLDENGLNFESSLVVSPLYLLRARSSFDKDADEFYRWRKKLEKAKEGQAS